MNQYIDIHSHILPNIDDGAVNMEQSMRMVQIAKREGVKAIIVTPHNREGAHSADRRKILERIAALQGLSDRNQSGITFYEGNEFHYRSNLTELLEAGLVCTLASSSYVLTEFSPMDDYAYIRNGLYRLLSSGYRPVVAHVERYQCMIRKQDLIQELINMGCYVQVNAGSVTGEFGSMTKRYAMWMIRKGYVHFISTDAHGDTKRAPLLQKCADKLYRKFDKSYVDELLYKNAEKIIADEYI